MATRQNKKRKGRTNAPPRERTVTTLTDGVEGSFLPPPSLLPDYDEYEYEYEYDDQLPPVLSPPISFSVGTPLSASGPPPFNPLQPTFSPSFPYSLAMPPLAGTPFQPVHSAPQFFPPQPQSISQSTPTSAHHSLGLPPGQSDLEILERLKQTIKNNQHELFRPVPQPAALASVYLGPKSFSAVPPHPEQVPAESSSPPGLTLLAHSKDTSTKPISEVSAATNVSAQAPSTLPSQAARRPSVDDAPKTTASLKRSYDRYEPPLSAKPTSSTTNTNGNTLRGSDASRMGPPGVQRPESTLLNNSPGKPARSETADGSALPGEPYSARVPTMNGKEDARPRDSAYAPRGSLDDRQQRTEPDRSSVRPIAESPRIGNATVSDKDNGNDIRGPSSRDPRIYDRDRDRERDRDRDFDRDRGRPLREESNRFRDERRNDDRPRPQDNRRLSPDARRYEPRYPPRRYDSKATDNSTTSPRLADRSPPVPRPHRNLGEERAIVRPPLDPGASRPSLPDERQVPQPVDDRSTKPLPVDDRRAPVLSPPGLDRQIRPTEDRRPSTAVVERPSTLGDKRPTTSERPSISVDDRRRPPSPPSGGRFERLADGCRHPPPSAIADRRLVDDRRPVDTYVPTPADDRRPSVSSAVDRSGRPMLEERRPPTLEERLSRAPAAVLPDSVPARPILEERGARAAQLEERPARPPVPLEERISRVPSLHERLSQPPVRQDDRPAPRLEDRLSRPAPTLEERLSHPAPPDDRILRPRSTSRPPRPPPPSERPPTRTTDDRGVPAEPVRAPPVADRPAPHAEDRVFTPADRYTRPVTPAAGGDHGRPPSTRPIRASSVARDEPRSFRPPSPGRSPARSDIREFRPGPAAEPRDRLPYRPQSSSGPGPEVERNPAPPAPVPAPAPEVVVVEPPHARPAETRMSYRRPSPPPADPYPARDRAWVPAGEAYRDPEPPRRAPEPPHSYTREWRDTPERPYGEDWPERTWDRDRDRSGRDYDRDARFVERDAVPPAWETREERERRAGSVYPADVPPPPPPPPRTYDRPLSARLSDVYVDERAPYIEPDRGRYRVEPPAPAPASAPSYSRVRPRSPSPLRRSGASDDMRPPPLKRARDDAYYYPDEPPPVPREYAPRLRTPPPAPMPLAAPGGGYYDDPRYPASPGRERDYLDLRERDRDRDVGYAGYDRRVDAGARIAARRSPPPYVYGRDDRRY
ncbi:hypothetical protein C8Q77DRAFT_1219708 [Trametes polyzona]|nr:hypothetical protein C8Q77DRAFT_1219708 [Trametes polyzona]